MVVDERQGVPKIVLGSDEMVDIHIQGLGLVYTIQTYPEDDSIGVRINDAERNDIDVDYIPDYDRQVPLEAVR